MSFKEWKEVTLGDAAKYSNAKIRTDELTHENYVSTENMLPGKAGIKLASSIPNGSAIKFESGQTLISNIRPYFKKIWRASIDGGCSTDVLVFDTIDEVDDKYFFYYLNQDHFFDYVMGGSKGTKMPRGDKQQILKYPFKYPMMQEQKAIAATLSSLDDKIDLNNRINKNLEEMAQVIFKSWFVDFAPFQDGEFENSELGMIPKGWKVGRLGDVIDIHGGLSYKSEHLSTNGNILVTMGSISGVSRFNFNGIKRYSGKYNKKYELKPEDIVIATRDVTQDRILLGSPAMIPDLFNDQKIIAATNVYKLYNKSFLGKQFIYNLLRTSRYREEIIANAKGTTVLMLIKSDIENFSFVIPPEDLANKFEENSTALYKCVIKNMKENIVLQALRDTLLPKLMSGEIRVPIEEVQQ